MKYLFFVYLIALISLTTISCSKKRDGDPNANASNLGVITKNQTAGIVTARELLTVFSEGLNVDYTAGSQENNDLLTDYKNFSSSLPKYGDHGLGFTSVMSRIITNFAARTCLISSQKDSAVALNSRVVFRFIDIKGNLTDAINMDNNRWKALSLLLENRLWGMTAPQDEQAKIDAFIQTAKAMAVSSNNITQVQDAAIQLCTLIASAPRAFFKN